MTQDKRLTEQQRKFAELLVYNEGRLSPAEAAYQAGYKTRARQAASEMRNAKYSYESGSAQNKMSFNNTMSQQQSGLSMLASGLSTGLSAYSALGGKVGSSNSNIAAAANKAKLGTMTDAWAQQAQWSGIGPR